MARTQLGTGAKWEDTVGYSRAVKVGNIIEIAGTTASKGGKVIFEGDVYNQTRYILGIMAHVLHQLDGKLEDVVRTRIYLKRIEDWEEAGRAHGEFFHTIKPVSTMLAVSSLIHSDMLVEIEATAIIT